jgi:hypothetical protein
MYRRDIDGNVWTFPTKQDIREQLRGKDLACWCPLNQPCHADVLLEIANAPEIANAGSLHKETRPK